MLVSVVVVVVVVGVAVPVVDPRSRSRGGGGKLNRVFFYSGYEFGTLVINITYPLWWRKV